MEGESDSGGRSLIPEGDQILIIKSFELVEKSSKGNPYFYWTLESEEGIEVKVVTTLIKGKRWLLKQILFACGVEAKKDDPDQKYNFNDENVLEKRVIGNIKHIENKFIGREGNEISYPKAEVNQFKKIETEVSNNKSAKNKKDNDEEIPF